MEYVFQFRLAPPEVGLNLICDGDRLRNAKRPGHVQSMEPSDPRVLKKEPGQLWRGPGRDTAPLATPGKAEIEPDQ